MEIHRASISRAAKELRLDDSVRGVDDAKRSQLNALLLLGKRRGYLTHAEIIELRQGRSFGTATLDLITAILGDLGIRFYPREPSKNIRGLIDTDFFTETEKGSVCASNSWDEALEFGIVSSPLEVDEKLITHISASAYSAYFLNDEISRYRMALASDGGVQHFCFLLADLAVGSSSRFFWFQSTQELCNVLCNDLWVRIFEGNDLSVICKFNESMFNLLRELKKNLSSGEVVKYIDDIWFEHSASSSLRISYVGTYETLCKGNNSFERLLRQKFRGNHSSSIKGEITEVEVVTFNEYISSDIS